MFVPSNDFCCCCVKAEKDESKLFKTGHDGKANTHCKVEAVWDSKNVQAALQTVLLTVGFTSH